MPATGDAVNVKVALRCRPLSKKELSEGDRSIFTKDGNVARLQDPDGRQNGGSPIEFGFDHVYDADSTQLQVYEDVGKPVVDAAFQGFNTTVFAYGQTGSGKSWSMTGGKDEQRGLIPRINAEIFERIESSSEEKLYLVQCSYFEIYNEIVYDLLDPRPRKDKERSGGLQIKEHPVLGIHVQGLQQIVAGDAAKVQELMDLGQKNRSVGSTDMNAESSRSHSVCLVTVHQKDTENESKSCYAKLNLVDLAGSERADRTGASGKRLKEGANINKSLTTLGSVINALVEQARGKKGVFIQYRNSKLTRVLQESLGGNALCTMLATLSPALLNGKETLSTLRYAARAKTIKKTVTKNEESGQIDKLNEEVARLKKMLAEKATVPGVVQDDEALSKAQSQIQDQIREMEMLTKQTWAEKQEQSKKHESEMQRLRKATRDAAKRAESERRKRFQLLREKGDVELSVRELNLPSSWADQARRLDGLKARVGDRRAHLNVLRDALLSDLGASHDDEDPVERARSAKAAADSAQGRLCGAASVFLRGVAAMAQQLSGELDKMREGETSLLKGADALIADVEAALSDFVTQQDRTKKARVELVLDQCKARRGALRASLASERAALVSSDDGGSDLVRAAQQLVQEAERASENADDAEALRTARDALQEASSRASSSAHNVREALAAVSQRAESDAPARPPARPVAVSSGDVKTACLGRGDGWMNTPQDYAEFDVGDAHVASVKIAPGTVSAQIDGADAKITIARLSSALDWKTLRLTPEKALKLLQRPPVRFVADALHAISTKAGWTDAPDALDPKAPNDVKQAHFDKWLTLIPCPSCSSDNILAGSGVDGTNALLQLAAAKASPQSNVASTPHTLEVKALRQNNWEATEVRVTDGRAPIGASAERWRVSVTKWETGSSGACKLGLETGTSGPSLSESAMNAGEAASALDADAEKLARCMRETAEVVAKAAQSAARKATRGEAQRRASESQRLADLEAEVSRLRVAEKKHLSIQSEAVEREKLLREEASKATEKLRDSEGKQRELETQARLAQTKSEDLTRKLEGASTELATVQQKVDQVTSDLNDAKKALSTNEASLREVREKLQEYQNKLTQAQAHEIELQTKTRAAEDALREAEAQVRDRDARLESLRTDNSANAELTAALESAREAQEKMREADAVRLKEADAIADDLRNQLDKARSEVLAAQESLRVAKTESDDKEKGLWEARTKALQDVQRLSTELDDARTSLQSAKEALIAAESARDTALASQKQAELELLKLQGAYDAAQTASDEASKEVEESKRQSEDVQDELRRLKVDAAASEDLVKEAEGRAVQTELELTQARDAERQLRSELEAVRARLEEGDDELAKRDDQCVQLAQELDDARAEGEAAADVAEQTRLALAVAEEERDAARGAEERLTYELERVVEERDDGMDGYVRLTEQLNDARDELTDAQEQVEAYKEREANNMRGVLSDRQDIETRVAEVRREMSEEHESMINGLEKLKRRLERHLKKIDESPLKRPPNTIDAVAALLDCALDKYDELLEQRPHTPDVEFDDGAMDAFDAALKRAAEPHKPSPADTSTQPLENDDSDDGYGDDDFED